MKIKVKNDCSLIRWLLQDIHLRIHILILIWIGAFAIVISTLQGYLFICIPFSFLTISQLSLMIVVIKRKSFSPFFEILRSLPAPPPKNKVYSSESLNKIHPFSSEPSPFRKLVQNPDESKFNENRFRSSTLGLLPGSAKSCPVPPKRAIKNFDKITIFFPEISGRLKFCSTCKFFRPKNTVHCAVCGTCIQGFDHHCVWLNNCIGGRNYSVFAFYICLTTLDCFLCFAYFVWTMANDDRVFIRVLLGISSFFAIFSAIPCTILIGFHILIWIKRETTYEFVKRREKEEKDRELLEKREKVLELVVVRTNTEARSLTDR